MKLTNKQIMLTALLTATSFSSIYAMDADRAGSPLADSREGTRRGSFSDSKRDARDFVAAATRVREAAPTREREASFTEGEDDDVVGVSAHGAGSGTQLDGIKWPTRHSLFSNHALEIQDVTVEQLLANLASDELAVSVADYLDRAFEKALTINTSDAGTADGAVPYLVDFFPASRDSGYEHEDPRGTRDFKYLNRFPLARFGIRCHEHFRYQTGLDRQPGNPFYYLDAEVAATITIPDKARDAVALAQKAGVLYNLSAEVLQYLQIKQELKLC